MDGAYHRRNLEEWEGWGTQRKESDNMAECWRKHVRVGTRPVTPFRLIRLLSEQLTRLPPDQRASRKCLRFVYLCDLNVSTPIKPIKPLSGLRILCPLKLVSLSTKCMRR